VIGTNVSRETFFGGGFSMTVTAQNEKTVPKLVKSAGSAVDAISGLLKNKLPEEPDAKALRLERLESCAETLL
jgi:hypothetical protein